jgi:hypothetical protein
MLNILSPQEGVLLFARGRELTPSVRLLQSILISLRSGDFISIAGAALQVFFPIAVLIFTLFISVKLFFLILIFLFMYGFIYQYKASQLTKADQSDRIAAVRQSWFYRWMGSSPRRMRFYFANSKFSDSPWTLAADASMMSAFRYSASLLLLSAAAFLIISETLPTGLLLPIAFFSQRLLQPAERIRQITTVYKVFTLAAVNQDKILTKNSNLVASEDRQDLTVDPKKKVDSLNFLCPLEIKSGSLVLRMTEPFELIAGQILVVSAGIGSGKTLLLESILGVHPVQSGRIDLKTQYSQPWDLIRYLNQSEFYDPHKGQSFYATRLNDIKLVLANSAGQLVVIDDPMMGMDARARNLVVDEINRAKSNNATMVIASNDRQLVDLCDSWLTISDAGEMQLRNKKA